MLGLAGQGVVESLLLERAVFAQTASRVSLKLRKEPKHLDVTLAGIGDSARVVQERSTKASWRGEITRSNEDSSTQVVAQEVAMPEVGLASVRLRGSGSAYQLEVTSVSGSVLPKPEILATGDDLVLRFRGLTDAALTRQTGALDLRRPGRVPQPVVAPPLRPRAVAPPLGDMAVGTMLIDNRSFVKASGPPVSLTLNNAPAKDALMSLARLGGYGFVFVGDAGLSTDVGGDTSNYPVTMAFRNERYDRALNSVLMSSGLQGRLDGNTLLVGTAVSAKSFGPQMSKVFRMNQVDVASASAYLGNLGALIQVTTTTTTTARESESSGTSSSSSESSTTSTSKSSVVDAYSSGSGPLLGLVGTTDSRLNTITLVGDPKLISVAEGYLKQIDLRKRQVAVKVQILSVTLDNDKTINSSFSSRIGDKFIVSDNGNAHLNFGKYKPSSSQGTGVYSGNSGYLQPGVYETNTEVERMKRFVRPFVPRQIRIPVYDDKGVLTGFELEDYVNERGEKEYYRDPNPGSIEEKEMIGRNGKRLYEKTNNNERYRQPDDSFYSYLNAVIVSSSAKTLAQPTLLVQEGEEAKVEAGESVITGRSTTETSNGTTEFSFTRQNAGLELMLKVSKIDDNGFVTMTVNPEISVPVGAGTQGGVPIYNISGRKLKSGSIRLRDRQTLILTGVIQESDRQQVQKWPILGDLPLVGQLFRGSSSTRQKNELVIVVTPTVLDDDNAGAYGYGYRPATPAGREFFQAGP